MTKEDTVMHAQLSRRHLVNDILYIALLILLLTKLANVSLEASRLSTSRSNDKRRLIGRFDHECLHRLQAALYQSLFMKFGIAETLGHLADCTYAITTFVAKWRLRFAENLVEKRG